MSALVRIKIVDDQSGSPGCPCEVVGEVTLPADGYQPEVWPVRRCVRCGSFIVDIFEDQVGAAVENIRRLYPASTVEGEF